MYHTQESREKLLKGPIKCVRENAWLGDGYYFWYDEQDAFNWGYEAKDKTGAFEVYQANLDCEDVLDTVFNEDHYKFWVKQIEKAAKTIMKKSGEKPSIKRINQYFKERAQWSNVTGVMFQDLPANEKYVAVQKLFYKKRIQLAVYVENIIANFQLKEKYNTLKRT